MKVKVMIKLTHSITPIYSILECRVECRIRNEGRVNGGGGEVFWLIVTLDYIFGLM